MEHRDVEPIDRTDLFLRARSGEPAAWDQLIDAYEGLVWAVIRSFGLSSADALDVAQLTWLRLVESMDKIEKPDRLNSWLVTTAKRACIKILDQQSRTRPTDHADEFALLKDPADPFEGVEKRDAVDLVYSAFSSLGSDCQTLLRLILADPPVPYVDISGLLGISIGTIGPRRQRCLGRLRTATGL